MLYSEHRILALAGRSPEVAGTLDVLGSTGREIGLHEGYGVMFELGAEPCDHYLLAAYGIDRQALNQLAESLELIEG